MNNSLVQRKMALNKANLPVSYLTEDDIGQLTRACKRERDQLLIMVLFQTGLRISEALALTPDGIWAFEGRPAMEIIGKGRKLFPSDLNLIISEINLYLAKGKTKEAQELLDVAVSKDPNNPTLHFAVGANMDEFGNFEQAEKSYLKAKTKIYHL